MKILILLIFSLLFFMGLYSAGLYWGVDGDNVDVYLPDELSHSEGSKQLVEKDYPTFWYPKFFSLHSAVIGLLGGVSDQLDFLRIARGVSFIYGLLTLLLIFAIGRYFGGNITGFFAMYAMGFSQIMFSQSTLGVPTVAGLFWFLLAVYLIYIASKNDNNWVYLIAIIVSSIAFSVQANFMPLIFITILLIVRARKSQIALFSLFLFPLTFIGIYWITNGSFATLFDISTTLTTLKGNSFVAIIDRPLWQNPFLIAFGLIVGSSFTIFMASIIGAFKTQQNKKFWFWFVMPFVGWLIAYFFKFTIFPRYLLIFLPLIALFTGLFFKEVREKLSLATMSVVIILVFLIPVGVTFEYVNYFSNQPRLDAYDWLENNVEPNETIMASRYFYVVDLNNINALSFDSKPDYIVLHEAYYGRYIKRFTSGFNNIECVSGVHHPSSMENCEVVQSLYYNGTRDYGLVKKFEFNSVFPEKLIFNELFGFYTFHTGNVLIYKRLI